MSCGKECENCGQVGGDGYGMSMTENIAGQPVVEAYNCCDNPSVPAANVADATNQVGGGVNPFNFIINPVTGARLSLFSSGGKALLKNMIRQYKTGGMDPESAAESKEESKEEAAESKEESKEESKIEEEPTGTPTEAEPGAGDGTTEEGDDTKTVKEAGEEASKAADNYGKSTEDSRNALKAAENFANASEETGLEEASKPREELRGVRMASIMGATNPRKRNGKYHFDDFSGTAMLLFCNPDKYDLTLADVDF